MFYEEAARVPLLVAHPGQTPAGVVDDQHLISTGLDILPSLCEYAGAAVPEHCFGRSFAALVAGEQVPWRDGVYAVNQHSRMWVERDRKYVRYDHGSYPEQLYDLVADPGETRSAASDPQQVDHLDRIRHCLETKQQRHEQYRLESVRG